MTKFSALSAPSIVWATWTIMVFTALVSIGKYHHEVPICEDWEYVAYATGAEPIIISWLWDQETEHRFPLTRLVGVALLRIADCDNWAIMLFRVSAMGGLALAMIVVAKKIRGWTSYADAFFPLVFFQWAASPHMLRGVTGLGYTLPTYIAGVLLLIVVTRGTRLDLGSGILAGLCLILLPLCGGMGLVYLPAMTLWFAYSGVCTWRSLELHGKRNSLAVLALALAVVLLVAYYFVGFQKGTSYYPSNTSIRQIIKTSLAFLTKSMGRVAPTLWPSSGPPLLILLALSARILFMTMWRNRSVQDSRAFGLFFFGAAIATQALAIGWARGVSGTGAAWSYEFLPALTLPWIYFVWVLCGPKAFGNFMQMCLFVLMVVVAPVNIATDYKLLTNHFAGITAFKHDMEQGVPPYVLIARHQLTITTDAGWGEDLVDDKCLLALRRAQIGSFRHLQDNPPFRELLLTLKPRTNQATWNDETVHGMGEDSYITFALPEPMFVAGVRIRGKHSNEATAVVVIIWGRLGNSGFSQTGSNYSQGWYGEDYQRTFYVADTIDQVRVFPDNKPSGFSITELVLLIPEAKP